MNKWIFRGAFGVSLLANVTFGLFWFIAELNAPSDRIGKLKEDTPLAVFGQQSGVYVVLPKGMVVRDSSPNFIAGIGMFEPHRFEIEVTTERDLVDWSADTSEKSFGAYYSADSYYDFEAKQYVHENP